MWIIQHYCHTQALIILLTDLLQSWKNIQEVIFHAGVGLVGVEVSHGVEHGYHASKSMSLPTIVKYRLTKLACATDIH